jgi:NAD(P)-dependent dehydrogenase (short-subunit alcohol dehydrogenase family)
MADKRLQSSPMRRAKAMSQNCLMLRAPIWIWPSTMRVIIPRVRSSIWRPGILSKAGGSFASAVSCSAARRCVACCRRGGARSSITGASASLRGRPNYGAFNSAKAGLRVLAQAMAKEYAEDGIHVGHVVVDGAIAGEKIFQRFPDRANREESLISIEAIVNAFAFLYGQPPRGWSFEVDVRTSRENW